MQLLKAKFIALSFEVYHINRGNPHDNSTIQDGKGNKWTWMVIKFHILHKVVAEIVVY